MESDSVAPNEAPSVRRAAEARRRLRGLLGRCDLAGAVLTSPAAVAWVTGGVSPPVDRTASVDLVWAVVTATAASLVTTEVEAPRLFEEYVPARHGFELLTVPWFGEGTFDAAASEAAGAGPDTLGSDATGRFGHDLAADLVALRLELSEPEQDEMRALGELAARALGEGLRAWRPGRERDLDIQSRVVGVVEAGGGDTPVVIVGGDDRVTRFRHPLALGATPREQVMAVVVARRGGLHVAATRYAFATGLTEELALRWKRTEELNEAVLGATRPGATYGDALSALERAYRAVGAPGAWREHYQGGPIGFAQREFEIAPGERDSRWYDEPVRAGHAVAWNPSLAGGCKLEDTYLVGSDGLEPLTLERSAARDVSRPGLPGGAFVVTA